MSFEVNAEPKFKLQGRISTLRSEIVNAYEIAVRNGFEGTEEEWLESLKGRNGCTFIPCVDEEGNLSWTNDGGHENPDVVCIKGYVGKDGKDGKDGADGYTPVKGEDYFTEADKKEFEDNIKESVPMVLHDAQSLTDEQKLQARKNIGSTGADLAGEVLATIAQPRNIQFLRANDIVQMKTTLDDGQIEITQITLDAYEKPMIVEKDGAVTYLTWEGFD